MKVSNRQRHKLLKTIGGIKHDERMIEISLKHPRIQRLKLKNFDDVLGKLEAADLIDVQYFEDKADNVMLTRAGNIYFEMRSDEFWRFVRRSILVPIAVSFVTTVLLWWLSSRVTGSLI